MLTPQIINRREAEYSRSVQPKPHEPSFLNRTKSCLKFMKYKMLKSTVYTMIWIEFSHQQLFVFIKSLLTLSLLLLLEPLLLVYLHIAVVLQSVVSLGYNQSVVYNARGAWLNIFYNTTFLALIYVFQLAEAQLSCAYSRS